MADGAWNVSKEGSPLVGISKVAYKEDQKILKGSARVFASSGLQVDG